MSVLDSDEPVLARLKVSVVETPAAEYDSLFLSQSADLPFSEMMLRVMQPMLLAAMYGALSILSGYFSVTNAQSASGHQVVLELEQAFEDENVFPTSLPPAVLPLR